MPGFDPDEVVGREQELEAIDRLLDRAACEPAALVIEGEPGLGKSTLWLAGLAASKDRSFRILDARPAEPEAQMSYAGLSDLLAEMDQEVLSLLPAPQERALGAALLRSEAEGPATEQRAVGMALLGVLRTLGERGPVLIAIDDLQWLDSPSHRVLAFALRRLERDPVGLLATRRTPALPKEGLAIAGEAEILTLGPLSLGALRHLVRARLGVTLSHPAQVRLAEASGGNPFFALELARALARRGTTLDAGWSLPVPGNLHSLIEDRLADLSPSTREVLVWASALASPSPTVIRAAVGNDDLVEAAIGEAQRLGVLTVEDDRIRFTHPLLRSVLFQDTPQDRRRELHRTLAAIVVDPEEHARHLAQTTEGPDAAVASVLDVGARHAHRRGAPDAAAELTELARRLTPPDHVEAGTARTMDAALYHFHAGETAAAHRLIGPLVSSLPRGAERARALWTLSAFLRYDGNLAEAVQAARQALVEAGEEKALSAQILLRLAFLEHEVEPDRSAEHSERAVSLARQLGDGRALMESLTAYATARFLTGHGVQEASVAEAFELARLHEPELVVRHPALQHAEILVFADRLDEARPLLDLTRGLADRRGDESVVPHIIMVLAELECRAGRYGPAEAAASVAHEMARAAGQERFAEELSCLSAYLDALRGRMPDARQKIERTTATAIASWHVFVTIQSLSIAGFIELSDGQPADAVHPLLEATRLARDRGYRDPGLFRCQPDAIEALASVGRADEAQVLLDELDSMATALARPWALAAAARCNGLILAARSDVTGAVESLEEALRHHERLDQPFERARTLLALGGAQRRLKRKRQARAALQEALEIFERLGTPPWADRARMELGRIGGRAPSPADLTPTERQVADLVALGRTNREAAEALFMSVNTVETHLSRIYRKLGVRSRTELAAKLGERHSLTGGR